ncbi:MAG: hypothetical protein LBK83_10545 [Treponema sp.]|jgi:hypothetical protein|nr:hypothetical protein [Treponema sp.]
MNRSDGGCSGFWGRCTILVFFCSFLIFSCKGLPKTEDPPPETVTELEAPSPPAEKQSEESGAPPVEKQPEEPVAPQAAEQEEEPSVVEVPGEPENPEPFVSVPEPLIDLAEAGGPEEAPPEAAVSASVPEPASPPLPPAVPPPSEPELPESTAQAGPSPAEGTAETAETADTERRPPPADPRRLRPAEEEPPLRIVREEPETEPVPEAPALPREEMSPVPAETAIEYSRIVRATAGQLVEVPFRGTGWVYLGELAGRSGISYDSRRLDPEGQSFIFRAEKPGTYGLKFYRQDFIRDYIINDHVQVIVGEPSRGGGPSEALDRGRVVANPRWPEIDSISTGVKTASPPAEAPPVNETVPAAPVPPTPVPAGRQPELSAAEAGDGESEGAGIPLNAEPEQLISRAREEFEAGKTASAIAVLDEFYRRYPPGTDETWWLYGQFYEANSPARDIKRSVECYRKLVNEYPQSRRYNDAKRRIAYLERYYFNIQ